jgi:hypothetical protein
MTDNAMIGKIEKAKRYAAEPERFTFTQFSATVHGENSDHVVSYQDGIFHCDCGFFSTRQTCSHSMAMERLLKAMLKTR